MIDRLLINGNIHTLAPDRPRASAIAIRDGKIDAVGDGRLTLLASHRTPIDDLGGATVLPGFTDAHLHWGWTSQTVGEIDLFDVPTKAEALRRIADAGAHTRPGDWLVGWGWSQAMWDGGQFPTAADLDAVTPEHPVYLRARSGHAAWVNRCALAAAGIHAGTPDPRSGRIVRDEHGAATGILLEAPAMALIRAVMPSVSAETQADRMEQMQKELWRCGLTGFHDFDDPDVLSALQVLRERGALGVRVVKNINRDFLADAIRSGLRWGFGDDWLRLGGLKLFADGALGPRTALMMAPYDGEPGNVGVAIMSRDEMLDLTLAASRAGFPTAIHAIGDRAVHDVLDLYTVVRRDEAACGVSPAARRHRIEHVQIIDPGDSQRLAELDIIASMQPIHATSDYPMADRYWGKRAWYSYNPRLQLNAGARVALGSDSPVEPFAPLKGIHAAVTRRRADGSPGAAGWYPDARLTIDEAIRGFTQGPAYAAGMEHKLGTIAPGYLADLVLLDHDLTTIAPDDLLGVNVIGTMVGGEWRWRA
ncbi:MAG TPA: amidohydrolase [Aggregatilineales bacterium]|nr:amidohydrolase [Aggregatilineales bacterium]